MSVAWDQTTSSRDFLKDFWATLKQSLTDPHGFFTNVGQGSGMIKPFIYGVFISTVAFTCVQVFSMGLGGFTESASEYFWLSPPTSVLGVFFMLLMSFLMVIVTLLFNSGLLHLCLLLLGAASRPFEHTFRVICYSRGPEVFMFIPVLGMLVGGIWTFVLVVIGAKTVHQSNYARVLLAVFLPLLVCGGIALFLLMAIGGGIMAGALFSR